MTKSVLQKILIRLVLLATGIVLSTQVCGQGWDAIYANQTEGIRLRQMNGSQSKDSLSVKTTSNTIIWNSWGISQTSEKFLNTKSGYTFDMQTQFVDLSYTLGETWTTTLGVGIPSGTGKITTSSNIEYKSSTVSGSGYFAVFGLEIGIFEFLPGVFKSGKVLFTMIVIHSRVVADDITTLHRSLPPGQLIVPGLGQQQWQSLV